VSDVSTSPAVRRIAIASTVIIGSITLGTRLARSPVVGLAVASMCAITMLLFLRPPWFLMLGIFFYYRALTIVDTELVGRLPGFLKLKDVFFVILVAYTAATEILAPPKSRTLRNSVVFVPWLLFLGWFCWQMFYTVKVIGEDPVLAFRAGRHFLAYFFPFIFLRLLRSDNDWNRFLVFLQGMALVAVFLSLLSAVGIEITVVGERPEASVAKYAQGVFKFYNPAESLVYAMFMFNLWRYAYRPTPRNLLMSLILAVGCSMFVFRARLIGLVLGTCVAFLFAKADARRRVAVVGIACILVLALALTIFGVMVAPHTGEADLRDSYIANLAGYFQQAVEGLRTGDRAGIPIRQMYTELRLPLVKQRPLCGMGFVSPYGRVALRFYRYGLLALGVVDVGWLDALMRLGGIGTALLAALLACSAVAGRRLLKAGTDLPVEGFAFALALVGFVVQMFVSVYSYSYPTREYSIVTFAILLAWVLHFSERSTTPTQEETPDQPPMQDRATAAVRDVPAGQVRGPLLTPHHDERR